MSGAHTHVRVEILVQGKRLSDGKWEVLGDGDRRGNRADYWRHHLTPGAFGKVRTIERTTTTLVEERKIKP